MAEHRPGLDIDKVTTGEHWLASQAKQLGLVDALCTSDDYLLAQASHHKVVGIRYSKPKEPDPEAWQAGGTGAGGRPWPAVAAEPLALRTCFELTARS